MATVHHLYERLTRDDRMCIGRVKVCAPNIDRSTDNGRDEGPTLHYTAQLAIGVDLQRGARALEDLLAERHTSTCWHSYDCCGCMHARARVTFQRNRTLRVRVSTFRNY